MKHHGKFYEPEFIENYVRGACSAEEQEMMQKILQIDADLQAEVSFQEDLFEAIANSRKQDLKKLLQNTPIPPQKPLYQKPMVQVAVSSFLIGVAIVATWLLNQEPKKTASKNALTRQNKSIQKIDAPKTENKEDNQTVEIRKPIAENNKKALEAPKENKLREKPTQTKEDKNPTFVKEIYYQYDGAGVLQLFGDFKYELLEKVDVGAGEKTYIYIQNQFFELIPTAFDEVRSLKESLVTDKEQIRLLTEKLPHK